MPGRNGDDVMDFYKTVTDETLRETVRHGSSSYPFSYYQEDIWQFDFHRIDWHWHHELEFLYVAEGVAFCLVGTDQIALQKGFGIFINSGILHRFEATGSTYVPNIVFSPTLLAPEKSIVYEKYIAPVIHSLVPYQVFDPCITWQNEVMQLLGHIFELQETGENRELCTVRLLLQMWNLLVTHLDLNACGPNLHRFNHRQATLQIMMQYIHDHYREELTLAMIAAAASVSKSGALHIFQSGIGISPIAYLIRYRLAQAAEQLYTTQKSVLSIAEETGFASSGYFCRKFRQHYHMSPKEYARERRNVSHAMEKFS